MLFQKNNQSFIILVFVPVRVWRVGGAYRRNLRQGTSVASWQHVVLIWPTQGLNLFSRVRRLKRLRLDHLGTMLFQFDKSYGFAEIELKTEDLLELTEAVRTWVWISSKQ